MSKPASSEIFENLASQYEQVDVRVFDEGDFEGVAIGSDGAIMIAVCTSTGGGDARVSWTTPFSLPMLQEVLFLFLNQIEDGEREETVVGCGCK